MTIEINKQILPTNTHRHFQEKNPDASVAQRTHSAIIDGLIEAVSSEGLEQTTIKHIIDNAGITQDTFNKYFGNREEAIYAAASTVAAEIGYILQDGREPNEPVDEKMVRNNFLFMTLASKYPAWGRLMIASLQPLDGIEDISLEDFRNTLLEGTKAGTFKTPLTSLVPLQIATLITLAIQLKIENKATETTFSDTCKAVLRLLGHTSEQAEQVVNKVLE